MGLPLASTKVEISTRDYEGILKKAEDKVARSLKGAARVERLLIPKIARILTKQLQASPVVDSLLGAYAGDDTGQDLQAEFGLTDGEAAEGVRAVVEQLTGDNIQFFKPKINKTARATRVEVGLKWYSKDIVINLANDGRGVYQSSNGFTVPWLLYSLQFAGKVTSDHGITYFLYKPELQELSKSGEALMVDPDPEPGKGNFFRIVSNEASYREPYVVPRWIKGQRGENWVHDAAIAAGPIIEQSIERELRNVFKKLR